VLAILPGSRESAEVQYIAPPILFGCSAYPSSAASYKIHSACRAVALRARRAGGANCRLGRGCAIVTGQSHTVLAACDVTLIASGTATLEAALFKRPMVIGYHMHWLELATHAPQATAALGGLPNILCREFVVPELLQDAATPRRWRGHRCWTGWTPEKTLALQQRFAALHQSCRRDTAQLATDAIEKILAR
jgi:lipid-A-disaccharide synthase